MSFSVNSHFPGLRRLLPCNIRQTHGLAAPSYLPCRSRDEEELFLLTQGLRSEAQKLILSVAGEENGKEDLCISLANLFRRYDMLKSRAYRLAINNFISRETETHCSFHLDTEELILLWSGSG
jgi:hypothetical protein